MNDEQIWEKAVGVCSMVGIVTRDLTLEELGVLLGICFVSVVRGAYLDEKAVLDGVERVLRAGGEIAAGGVNLPVTAKPVAGSN